MGQGGSTQLVRAADNAPTESERQRQVSVSACECVCVCVVATGRRSDGSNTQHCTAADSNKTPCLPLITGFFFFLSSGLWPVDLCESFCNSLFISTKNYISSASFYVSFFFVISNVPHCRK